MINMGILYVSEQIKIISVPKPKAQRNIIHCINKMHESHLKEKVGLYSRRPVILQRCPGVSHGIRDLVVKMVSEPILN